jgi:D-alanine--poly(phosphoribitol) ligase subunit 1
VKDLIEMIKDNAKNYPDRIAVIDRQRKITYSDFLRKVNSISHRLMTLKPNPKIIIDLEQGAEAYALIVAVLNVGGTYCPLNPIAPQERKKQIIDEFAPDLIVTQYMEKVAELGSGNIILLDDLLTNINDSGIGAPYNGDDIIYVIYTSGSTGVPKGVKICRKALNKFLEWAIPTYSAKENDTWGQFSLLSFDLSIVDIFTCLCSGAALYAMNDVHAKKYRPAGEIEKAGITIWHSIPSAIEFMMKNVKNKAYDFTSLRLMSFCGEPLKPHQVKFLFETNTSLKIFNTYGPTEGTLFCTWLELNNRNYTDYSHYSISIGNAIPGWNIVLRTVEDFDEKEIIIHGDYIGKGYLGNAVETKFKKMIIHGKETECFETGDLVVKVDENLYFAGRKDRQVKIRGFRIELDEIDHTINKFLNLTSATIVNNDSLYSFIETDTDFNKTELREYLKNILEDYKIPNEFYPILEIPRNQNLKIDFNALKNKLNE